MDAMRDLQGFSLRTVEMGSCYEDYIGYDNFGKFLSCAWEPDDCNAGEDFIGSDQNTDAMRKCNPNDQPIGRCLQEDQCALRASDCEIDTTDGDNYQVDDETCTIQRDKSKEWDVENPEFTQFGSCKNTETNEYFCIYNPSDCEESGKEVYVNPTDTLAAGVTCDCSEVHVTACVTTSLRAFCAVNAKGCRPTWPAYSPHHQREGRLSGTGSGGAGPNFDCRLCRKKNTSSPTPSPTTLLKPTRGPTKGPTPSPVLLVLDASTAAPTKPAAEVDDTSWKTMGFIVGGSVVGVALIGVLFLMYVKMFRGKEFDTGDKKKDAKSMSTPPIHIAISSSSDIVVENLGDGDEEQWR